MRVGPRGPRSSAARRLSILIAAALVAGCGSGISTIGTTGPTAPGTQAPVAAGVFPAIAGPRLPGEPNPRLTPGAINPAVTQATIRSTICVLGWTTTVRPPASYTTNLKRRQIVVYGYRDHLLADYEEDHLVSLEIGGAPRDPKNLWPEPYAVKLSDGRSVGARVKDLIENRLHDLVCAGQISLAAAQHEEATDWISAWFKLDGQRPPPGASGGGGTATPAPTAQPTNVPPSGAITVTISSISSPVSRGASATLAARTKAGASCAIIVLYKSGPSKAQGLEPETANGSGEVTWTWTIGSGTTPGSWPVTVTCSTGGNSGSAQTTLVVH